MTTNVSDTSKEHPRRLSRDKAKDIFESLNALQRDIVRSLYNFRVMSTAQVGDMFSEASNPRDRRIIAGRSLRILCDSGLAVKVAGGVPKDRGRRACYHLSRSGVYVVLDEMGVKRIGPVRDSKYRKIIRSTRARHHLATIDFAVSLSRKKNLELGTLCGWANDGDVVYEFGFKGSRRVMRPDARGIWQSAEGDRYPFHLELERTFREPKVKMEKVRKYIYFAESQEYVRYEASYVYPPTLWVVEQDKYYDLVRETLLKGSLMANYDIDIAAKTVTFGLAKLSDVKDFDRGALSDIWESVYDGFHGLTFQELSELARSKHQER